MYYITIFLNMQWFFEKSVRFIGFFALYLYIGKKYINGIVGEEKK